ncbi:MAG TPA: hypothetical protein PKD08_02705 [Gudongella oleilytica]|nr:hypothetical protein [Gudongella oleilytica]
MNHSKMIARICITSFNIGVLVLVLVMGISIGNTLLVLVAVVIFGGAFLIRQYKLRCNSCGHLEPLPSWKDTEIVICHKCGEVIDYDK